MIKFNTKLRIIKPLQKLKNNLKPPMLILMLKVLSFKQIKMIYKRQRKNKKKQSKKCVVKISHMGRINRHINQWQRKIISSMIQVKLCRV